MNQRFDIILRSGIVVNQDGEGVRDNALANRNVMEGARRVGAYVVALSTDYVFDGEKDTPYHEWDTPNPQSVYGESKPSSERDLTTMSLRILLIAWPM